MQHKTRIWNMSDECVEASLNHSMSILITNMFENGLISQNTAKMYLEDYAFVLRKPTFFGNIWKTVFKKDIPHIILVEQKSLRYSIDANKSGKVFDIINGGKE